MNHGRPNLKTHRVEAGIVAADALHVGSELLVGGERLTGTDIARIKTQPPAPNTYVSSQSSPVIPCPAVSSCTALEVAIRDLKTAHEALEARTAGPIPTPTVVLERAARKRGQRWMAAGQRANASDIQTVGNRKFVIQELTIDEALKRLAQEVDELHLKESGSTSSNSIGEE